MKVGRGSGGGWIGLVLVSTAVMTVLGGVLLTMMDASQAMSISVATATATLVSLPPLPTASPTPATVTVSLPSPTPLQPTPHSTASTPTRRAPPIPTQTAELQPTSTPEVVVERCTPPSGWVAYTVGQGDTVFSLSTESQVSADAVSEANCLSSDILYPGSIIYLPAPPQQPMIGCGPPMDWVLYTVKLGDTLYSLASQRGLAVAEVIFANCLPSASISAGVGLYLPVIAEPLSAEVATPMPGPVEHPGTVCLISSPADGSQVSGSIALLGSATTERFLFYKIEASGPQTDGSWASLLGQVVYTPVQSGLLGTANLTGWQPGDYTVRLVIVDNTSNEVGVCYAGLEVTGS